MPTPSFDLDAELQKPQGQAPAAAAPAAFDLDAELAKKPAAGPQVAELGWLATLSSMFGDALKGTLAEAPLVAERAAMLQPRLVDAGLSAGLDILGAHDLAVRAREGSNQREGVLAKVTEPLREQPGASGAEKLGRTAAKAAPQIALATLTSGASLPVQAAVQGPAMAAQTASEGGGPGETLASGVLGSAAALLPAAVAKTTEWVSEPLERAAAALYAKALHPTKEATKEVAAEVIPELIERNVTAGPIAGLRKIGNLAAEEVQSLGKAVGEAYRKAKAAGTKMDGASLADAMESLKVPFTEVQTVPVTRAVAAGNPLTTSGLPSTAAGTTQKVVALNENAIAAISDIQAKLRELGTTNPVAIWKFRRVVDDVVSASNGFTKELPRGTARAIAKDARAGLKDALAQAVSPTTPNIETLNAEFSLWKGVRQVVKETERRQTGQQRTVELAVRAGLGSAYGAGIGGVVGGKKGAAEGALTGSLIVAALRSPFARTWTAVQMDALADLMMGSAKTLSTPAGQEVARVLALYGIKAEISPEDKTPPAEPQPAPAPAPTPQGAPQ